MLSWREHPEAGREAYEAAVWYADRELGLAERFARELQESLLLIREWPGSAPPHREVERTPPIRSKRVNGFPFRIIYLVQGDEVVVIAYAHERRRPGYWSHRLDG